MRIAIPILILLTISATLASWLLSREGARRNTLPLLVYGAIGVCLILGMAAFVFTSMSEFSLRWPEGMIERARATEEPARDREPADVDPAALRHSAQVHFQAKRYAQAAEEAAAYLQHRADAEDMHVLLAQALYLSNEYVRAGEVIDAILARHGATGAVVPTNLLQIRVAAARKAGDAALARVVELDVWQNHPQQREEFASASDGPLERPVLLVVSPHDTLPQAAPLPLAADRPSPPDDWPATFCVSSKRTDAGWILENDCTEPVAVVFAACPYSQASCGGYATSEGWAYEPTGALMTTARQQPTPHRLGDHGPPIAPLFAPQDRRADQRIAYLACYVRASPVLALLDSGAAIDSAVEFDRQLGVALQADECYARVRRSATAGAESRRAPWAVTREQQTRL